MTITRITWKRFKAMLPEIEREAYRREGRLRKEMYRRIYG